MEKSYRDALTVAIGNAGADASEISGWVEDLRRADDALDGAIARAVRDGEHGLAQQLADRGHALQACADFLQKLYATLERSDV